MKTYIGTYISPSKNRTSLVFVEEDFFKANDSFLNQIPKGLEPISLVFLSEEEEVDDNNLVA